MDERQKVTVAGVTRLWAVADCPVSNTIRANLPANGQIATQFRPFYENKSAAIRQLGGIAAIYGFALESAISFWLIWHP